MKLEDLASTSSPFGCLVRILTGHVVSSSSMVSRAYLTDSFRAIVVEAGDGSLWLVATLDALAPDLDGLRVRSEASGGPSTEYPSTASLVKVAVAWGDDSGRIGPAGEVDIANPRVVQHPGGASLGVVPLAKARALANAMEEGTGPVPLELGNADSPPDWPGVVDATYEELGVLTLFHSEDGSHWPVTRRALLASGPAGDFAGAPGAIALDLALESLESGSPAFSLGDSAAFRGLVRPLAPNLSMLLPPRLILETIAHARSV